MSKGTEYREKASKARDAARRVEERNEAASAELAARQEIRRLYGELADAYQAAATAEHWLASARQDAGLMQYFLASASQWKVKDNFPKYDVSHLGTTNGGHHSSGLLNHDYRDYRPDFSEGSRLKQWSKDLRKLCSLLGINVPPKGDRA